MTARWMTRWKPGGRLRVLMAIRHQVFEIAVDVAAQRLAQLVQIDGTGAHHGGRILIVDEAQEEMLQRRVLMVALVGRGQRTMQGLFEIAGE